MTVHDPPWRQKTRPCPFFSQGRCLFADSCNFLHDIKVKSAVDCDAQPVGTRISLPPKAVFNPPSVVVNSASPPSIKLSSPADDTSRYSGLLSVLQDVIGPTVHQDGGTLAFSPVDTSDNFLQNPQADAIPVDFNGNSQGQPKTLRVVSLGDISTNTSFADASTLVESPEPCHAQDSSVVETLRDVGGMQGTLTHHDIDSDGDKDVWDIFPSYVVEDDDEAEEQELDREEAQENLSPVTVLQFPHPPSRFSYMSTTSSIFSLLARPHGLTEEALDDSGQEVTNNLLSPVELSAGLRPFSVYSAPLKRDDSIDSGYADSWTGPTPLARSPPNAMRNSVAFDSTALGRPSISSLQNRCVSYDVRAVRPSPKQSVAEEHDDDTFSTSSILDAYEFSSSYDLDEEEESLSPTIRFTGTVSSSPSSPPVESSFPKRLPGSMSEIVPVQDIIEVLSRQRISAPEDDVGLAFLDADSSLADSPVSPLSSSTVRPSSVKRTPSTQEVVLVGVKSRHLSPSLSPSSQFAAADTVHINSRAVDVVTPSSASSSGNESEVMEGDLSSKTSMLSLGAFPSGPSSPNTSIHSVECDYVTDNTSQENVSSHPPWQPQSDLASAQLPIAPSAGNCTSDAKESGESFVTGLRERPKISPELLAHIGHVFSLSDDLSAPAGDVRVLDPTGGGDVEITNPRDTWRSALEVDIQQALRMSAASPVTFLPTDAGFAPDEADARTSWDPDLGDLSVNLRRWSDEENVPPAEEGMSTSSVEYDESDAPGEQSRSSTSEPWSEGLLEEAVALPATLTPSAGQIVGKDTDASLIQREHDTRPHDQPPDPLVDSVDVLPAVATGPTHDVSPFQSPSALTAEFVQRSRAISDVTVKPDSRSPSTLYFPPSPPANFSETNLDPDHSDFLQSLDDQNVDTAHAECQSMEVSVVELPLETEGNPHLTSPFNSIAHDQEDECSSMSVKTRVLPNLTIRIPSSSEAQPSSSSTAQSLPLILSLSNGHDTKRWFSSSDADGFSSSRIDVPPASAPVSSILSSREPGSTKVPFGFRRFNPQFVARKLLRDTQPSSRLALVSNTTARRESDATSQQLQSYPHSPLSDRFLSPIVPQVQVSTARLKPLRLSRLLDQRSSASSPSSVTSSILSDHIFNSPLPDSPCVSSSTSLSYNSLLPSPCPSSIPEHIHNTLTPVHDSPLSSFASTHTPSPRVHSVKRESQLQSEQASSWHQPRYRAASHTSSQPSSQCSTRRLSTFSVANDDAKEDADEYDLTICRPVAPISRPPSTPEAPVHAIAMPKPTLLFAIASDDVSQVRQVLESGEAGPNDQVGPQSALAFTLTNDQLSHKNEIVKALLAYGADPSALRNPSLNPSPEGGQKLSGSHSQPAETTPEGMDPATRYYVTRADTTHTRQTSQLIHRSFFRPLTRVRYDLIGQDWVLEQLFRVLSMHSQRLSVAPIVVLLCGPSGHGKSLLARKFGNLLDVPTHTVNMTTLRSTHDLWQSYSMSPYEEPSSDTLAQFLLNNEGERCVVVLDEIEKVEDPKALYSLLMPWELGRCSPEAGKRHVDVRNVIWLGTSNIGHDVVLEYCDSRPDPSNPVTREEYRELMELSRPHVSQCLGASLLSRVTTVLPFVPFTTEEKMAIAAEAVYSLAGNATKNLSPQDVEAIVMKVVPSYFPSEGARSLHRAVSNQLVELI